MAYFHDWMATTNLMNTPLGPVACGQLMVLVEASEFDICALAWLRAGHGCHMDGLDAPPDQHRQLRACIAIGAGDRV